MARWLRFAITDPRTKEKIPCLIMPPWKGVADTYDGIFYPGKSRYLKPHHLRSTYSGYDLDTILYAMYFDVNGTSVDT